MAVEQADHEQHEGVSGKPNMSEGGRHWGHVGTMPSAWGWEAPRWALTPPPPRPTEQDVRFRPADWPLPRPTAIHHIVEDFLTDWTAPVGHILPLRRFLENCLDTDLRSFYAGNLSCQRDKGTELEVEKRPDRAMPCRVEGRTSRNPNTRLLFPTTWWTSCSQKPLLVQHT